MPLAVACLDDDTPIIEPVVDSWRRELTLDVEVRTWTLSQVMAGPTPARSRRSTSLAGCPATPTPSTSFALLFQSDSRTNEGGFAWAPFDELIDRARRERSDQGRLRLFHDADRMAVADRVAVIPLVYQLAVVKPSVDAWWEFGKTSANYADLTVGPDSLAPECSDVGRERRLEAWEARGRHRRHDDHGRGIELGAVHHARPGDRRSSEARPSSSKGGGLDRRGRLAQRTRSACLSVERILAHAIVR
jgi:hypothetical protein